MTPAYLSRASLAKMLDCPEKTIDEMVRRGFIPPPRDFPCGPRWRWEDVDKILQSTTPEGGGDTYSAGVRNAAQISTKGDRHAA